MSEINDSPIKINNISKSFGELHLLKDVSFELKKGSVVGLLGPSGSGKSVLLKLIAGVLPLDSGNIDLAGIDRSQISLMFQEGALFDSLSVFDNIAFPLVNGKVPTATLPRRKQLEVSEKVMSILARVGLSKAAEKMPAQLSGGMRRRVSMARALVSHPALVLLDDPTCGLDPVASGVIMELILELQAEQKNTVIIVSQDLRRLIPNVQEILALFDGRIEFRGTIDELKQNANEEILHFINCRYDLNLQKV